MHEEIFKLDQAIIISPNFDSIYETYARQKTNGSILVKSYKDKDIAKYIRGGDNRLIIKSHGSASDSNIIFTYLDYAQARVESAIFYEVLKSLALTHTFLFIGCGINDPDIAIIFEDIRFAHGDDLPEHYMTIPKEEVDTDIMNLVSSMRNIHFCEYDSTDGHSQLTKALIDLRYAVEERRNEIAKNQKW
ncbi:SIR2 family NAD-dependent protein deacylase [Neisseria meningitidis]|uniref:SIR2 family NAD-dependent protein deacylase n=1 Tax=Neisseria meningitidis TaxID=487 RepID=UPI004028158E